MREAGIGRVLVASLHQGIADILPNRLGFYENWLNAEGLREGTIGLAPLYAVLSFLRQEGDAYQIITTRAGEYAAEWTVESMAPTGRAIIKAAPEWVRRRLILRLARQLVRSSYQGNRAIARLRRGTANVEVRASIFCTVREPVPYPLCGFYAAAVTRLMAIFNLSARAQVVTCRGTGEPTCMIKVALPERRERPAAGVCVRHAIAVACLLVSSAAAGATQLRIQPLPEPRRILVMPFDNTPRDARMFWLGEASAVLLADDLNALGSPAITRDERLQAFERLQVPPAAALTDATVIRIGQLVGAAQVVVGSLQLDGDTLVVHARSIALDTGRVEADVTERGPMPDLFATFERVARRLSPRSSGAGGTKAVSQQPTLPAFESYIKGLLAETPATAINYLNASLNLQPTFDRARLALWDVQTDQGEHERALEAVKPVAATSPWSRRAQILRRPVPACARQERRRVCHVQGACTTPPRRRRVLEQPGRRAAPSRRNAADRSADVLLQSRPRRSIRPIPTTSSTWDTPTGRSAIRRRRSTGSAKPSGGIRPTATRTSSSAPRLFGGRQHGRGRAREGAGAAAVVRIRAVGQTTGRGGGAQRARAGEERRRAAARAARRAGGHLDGTARSAGARRVFISIAAGAFSTRRTIARRSSS